ncbi:hypothetical protein DRF67_02385 [Chryseobacterium pennipullorum]|uniref:Uncharacterized protein n=1 Tax=Chryseobacterium pennipullorum TaxID=2258963 RepID=A0A3D9BAS2_9FLAO|nr:hypothetical protein DRF67_02385 [Chryseobacterium pennipullorum]
MIQAIERQAADQEKLITLLKLKMNNLRILHLHKLLCINIFHLFSGISLFYKNNKKYYFPVFFFT